MPQTFTAPSVFKPPVTSALKQPATNSALTLLPMEPQPMQDNILFTLKNPALWDRVQADLYDDLEVVSDSG
jgi:hypothetical protein